MHERNRASAMTAAFIFKNQNDFPDVAFAGSPPPNSG